MSKTLLLLGGSRAQIVGIEKAKELGYRAVVCDYLPDNPGQHVADAFHLVSTTDKEAILRVAMAERVDGVVAYGSDPAAPTAAYVAEKLGLPGIPYRVAKSFCEKHLFRSFLKERGFNVPGSVEIPLGPADLTSLVSGLRYPIIVKPTDSSGSKGVTVLWDPAGIDEAVTIARSRSRSGVVIAEEFIERDHPFVIEGEVFVVDGAVRSWGLINSIRDERTNPLLPAAYSYPLQQPQERVALVKSEVSRLVEESGVRYGAFNLEMIIDKDDRLFFLDVGPRNGGNMLPEFIGMIGGRDVIGATMMAAVGEWGSIDVDLDGGGGYWGLGVLHSDMPGVFESIAYSAEAQKYLVKECLDVQRGGQVSRFDICSDLVGLSFFHFDNVGAMGRVMEHPYESMRVEVS